MMNTKQRIVSIIRRELELAERKHHEAVANRAGDYASSTAWDDYHPDDGVGAISLNPYNLDRVDKTEMDTRKHKEQLKAAYDLAVDTFLETS